MDEVYKRSSSFAMSPAGQRPKSIHKAMVGGEQGVVEHLFFTLGEGIGRWALTFALLTVVGCAGLTSGVFLKGKVDTELFNSLVLRPRSRMQRETNYNVNRYDAGYASQSEVTNAVPSSGGKDVLTRKNLLQSAKFWRDKDVLGVEISHEGESYTGYDVLVLQGPQPYRFTIMDCWQEGAYDFFGTIGDLRDELVALEGLSFEAIAPFVVEGGSPTPRITPYNYCLYVRLALVYTPTPDVNPSAFGRCRQFLDEDAASDPDYAALEAAYAFHRFYLYDQYCRYYHPPHSFPYSCWRCWVVLGVAGCSRCKWGDSGSLQAAWCPGCAGCTLDQVLGAL